jgi:hypothetical protein
MAETEAERQACEAREQRERDAKKAAADRAVALDAYEAKHAAVHTAAITIINIKVLVPLVLDCAADNYNRWCAMSSPSPLPTTSSPTSSTPIDRRGCR